MHRIGWIALTAIRTLSRRYLNGRDLWGWHHHQMSTNDPYARILIQGVVKALWQETFKQFVLVLLKAISQLARQRKHGNTLN